MKITGKISTHRATAIISIKTVCHDGERDLTDVYHFFLQGKKHGTVITSQNEFSRLAQQTKMAQSVFAWASETLGQHMADPLDQPLDYSKQVCGRTIVGTAVVLGFDFLAAPMYADGATMTAEDFLAIEKRASVGDDSYLPYIPADLTYYGQPIIMVARCSKTVTHLLKTSELSLDAEQKAVLADRWDSYLEPAEIMFEQGFPLTQAGCIAIIGEFTEAEFVAKLNQLAQAGDERLQLFINAATVLTSGDHYSSTTRYDLLRAMLKLDYVCKKQMLVRALAIRDLYAASLIAPMVDDEYKRTLVIPPANPARMNEMRYMLGQPQLAA